MNLKNIGKVVTSKFFETGPSFYKKRIYWAAVSQRLRNTAVYCFAHSLRRVLWSLPPPAIPPPPAYPSLRLPSASILPPSYVH